MTEPHNDAGWSRQAGKPLFRLWDFSTPTTSSRETLGSNISQPVYMAPPTKNLDDEFRRVVQSFEAQAKLTPEELKCFQITTLDDLTAIISSIERRQTQRKRLVYLKRIEPFVNTMTEFGKIVEVFLNASDILAFVWVRYAVVSRGYLVVGKMLTHQHRDHSSFFSLYGHQTRCETSADGSIAHPRLHKRFQFVAWNLPRNS